VGQHSFAGRVKAQVNLNDAPPGEFQAGMQGLPRIWLGMQGTRVGRDSSHGCIILSLRRCGLYIPQFILYPGYPKK